MEISFTAPYPVATGAWVVGALEDAVLPPAAAKADKASGGAIKRALSVSRITGKMGLMLELLAPSGVAALRILLLGLGKASEFDGNEAEVVAADAFGRVSRT